MFLPLSFLSDLRLQREEGEERERQRGGEEGEGERKVFSNRNETLQFGSGCHRSVQNILPCKTAKKKKKKAPKPEIRLCFEHQGAHSQAGQTLLNFETF